MSPAEHSADTEGKQGYLQIVNLFERLHRRLLDVVKAELDRLAVHDANNVQALIVFNIGSEEYSVGDLTQRGYYLGTNITYNLKKLSASGYIVQARSQHDRRAVRVRLTEKGIALYKAIDTLFADHAAALGGRVTAAMLGDATQVMRALEQSWNDSLARPDARKAALASGRAD
ncbi:MAG TPA: MarR family winged helix-turn-helix transcriptional regulator [Alphaproteobacteria bacterium]|nr:MarR family winged helix-turn-helix transcriptional regulator [Alphaproteobacteria bacterium]